MFRILRADVSNNEPGDLSLDQPTLAYPRATDLCFDCYKRTGETLKVLGKAQDIANSSQSFPSQPPDV